LTLRAQRRAAPFDFRGVKPLVGGLLRRGLPVSLATALGRLGYRVDLIVVAVLLNVADVGRYSVATAAGESLLLLARAAITGAYAPMISAELGESVRVSVRMIRHCVALVVPAGLVLTLLAWIGMEPVFGPGFGDVWLLVGLLLPAFLALSIAEVLVHFLVVRMERNREFLVMAAATLVANLVVAAVLVSLLGLPGAALSTSIVQTLGVVYLMRRLVRAGAPADPRAYLPGRAELGDYLRVLGAARHGPRRLSRKHT
jgi:O-antigen/teichoic acid export membrane protein